MTDRAVFVDREKIMVPCGTTAEAWCARYDLEPFDAPCSSCGAVVRTTIPFAYRTLRGLIAPQCQCGTTDRPYCVVRAPKHGDLLDPY